MMCMKFLFNCTLFLAHYYRKLIDRNDHEVECHARSSDPLAFRREAISVQTWSKETGYLHAPSHRDSCGYPFVAWVIKKPPSFHTIVSSPIFLALSPPFVRSAFYHACFPFVSSRFSARLNLLSLLLEEIRARFHFCECSLISNRDFGWRVGLKLEKGAEDNLRTITIKYLAPLGRQLI